MDDIETVFSRSARLVRLSSELIANCRASAARDMELMETTSQKIRQSLDMIQRSDPRLHQDFCEIGNDFGESVLEGVNPNGYLS